MAAVRRSWPSAENDPWPTNHGLIHEHIVPRKWIENALYALIDPTLEQVENLLQLSENCIVTAKEDQRFGENRLKQTMPAGCELPRDKWKRYDVAKVIRFEGLLPVERRGA